MKPLTPHSRMQSGAVTLALKEASNTTNYADSMSLPLFDRFGSVHGARLKQQGRRFPLFIFEILTSTRRLRVSGFGVALTQRTHSQRAIGVTPSIGLGSSEGQLPELSQDPAARSALASL